MNSQSTVTVILPVYNESACIRQVFDTILEFSQGNPLYHFIFVNDGSSDNTQEILENAQSSASTTSIEVISHNTRQGKGRAIKTGVRSANSQYICFLDGDLAYSLDHLYALVDKLQKFDVVIGCRNLDIENFKNIKLSRKIAGQVFNFLSRKVLGLNYRDMQAGLKGFRGRVAKDLFSRQKLTGFAFDCEVLYIAQKLGYSIGEIPAKVSSNHQQKISKVKLVEDSLKMFGSLLKIKYNSIWGYYG